MATSLGDGLVMAASPVVNSPDSAAHVSQQGITVSTETTTAIVKVATSDADLFM